MEIQKRCKWCGKPFIAHKLTTLYCSHQCNSAAYKDAKRKEKIALALQSDTIKPALVVGTIGDKPYLSPSDVSLLLGVSRVTVYRYMASGLIKALQLKGRTRIRRSDVEKMFDESSDYLKRGHCLEKDSTKYTIDAIAEKYKLLRKTVKSKCEKYGIPAITIKRRVFYDKALVNEKFAELLEPVQIDSYYTAKQIAEKYNMTYKAVITFVHRHDFPRIKRNQTVYYSKFAVDEYKEKRSKVDSDYYTYEEIKQKFGFNKMSISYYVNAYGVEILNKGRCVLVLRESFDKAIREHKDGIRQAPSQIKRRLTSKNTSEKPIDNIETAQSAEPIEKEDMPALQVFKTMNDDEIPEGYCDADQIADEYKIRRPHVWKLTRENNIPKIVLHGINYYETKSVELFFAKYRAKNSVTEWISARDMEQKYSMTPDARRHFTSRHNIPSKVVFGKAYYSLEDIEKVKNNQFNNAENYYSIQEAMQKYELKREDVYGFVRYGKIQKFKYGKQVYLLKTDFDRLMEQKGQKKKDNS
jgi:excisionase family DNA binding protein